MGWALDMENKNTPANKVAIVTGSATGIGYETAIHLARNGFYTGAAQMTREVNETIAAMSPAELEKAPILSVESW
jgi:NAD(P)-dependent dehydrogenase (short-subunit alcohol dehydrogenase family)